MILFDASNTLLSKVIMFEYKFQNLSQTIPNLDNTVFGFVAVENAIQSGIVNQYIISVPVSSLTLDGVPSETIQVRVYYGDESSTDVVVSDWSNQLDVHLPPVTPVIYTAQGFDGAYYDPSSGDLFVLLEESNNNYDFNNVDFITCFFYQDVSDATLWKVSEPTHAQPTFFGPTPFRYIQVPLEGTVSANPLYNKVYVSIHAHYDWLDASPYYSGKSYHSVSYMSNEVQAILASHDSTPDITSVDYNVYNTSPLSVPGDQTMTISWLPPGNDPVPFFRVNHYELYYALDGSSNFVLYEDDIPRTTLIKTIDVGAGGLNLTCDQSIVFRVNAVDAQMTNTPSAPSASTNIFKYSEAVTDLEITDATWDGSLGGFKVNFNGVSDSGSPNKGCGTGLQYVVEINGSVYTGSGSLSYGSGNSYSIVYSGLPISQVGTVTVYLQTANTNTSPPGPMNGLPTSVPYIANTILLQPVVYEVYNTQVNTDQDMELTWSDPTLTNWSVVKYDVEYSTDSGLNWINTTNTNNLNYTFDASAFAVTSPIDISFRILATMENGSTQYVITSNTESKYTFKYAEAVTNLEISDATWDGHFVGFKVNFNGVSNSGSPNKGLGTGLQYVVEINGSVYTGSGSLSYGSGNYYSIVYSGLPISQVGTVTVYLQTANTNTYPAGPMNGLPESVPYIANTILLQPVVYQVYTTQVNTDQIMELNWTNPTLANWSVVKYDVEYSTDSGLSWINTTNTNNVNCNFNASTFAVTSPINISFRILATMENGLTQYVITSNTESKYTFKYAEDVVEPNVNWAVANTGNTTMDVSVQFKNPLTNGVNNGLINFLVTVRDQNQANISHQIINYDSLKTSFYMVNFNDITYSFEGDVTIEAFVNDSNSGGLITSPNYQQNPGYETSTVPLFKNIDVSGRLITGEIITHDLLKPIGVVIVPNIGQSGLLGTPLPYSTSGLTPGFEIQHTTQPNNELLYSFTIDIQAFFGSTTPAGCVISAANNAGIGSGGTPI
jgi:hypothetical protein